MSNRWLTHQIRTQIPHASKAPFGFTLRRCRVSVYLTLSTLLLFAKSQHSHAWDTADSLINTEAVSGEGIWIDPRIKLSAKPANSQTGPSKFKQEITVKVWFDRQVLGTGDAYQRRAMEFATSRRRELRRNMVETLQQLSESSLKKADIQLRKLQSEGAIKNLQPHWIINGFTCTTTVADIAKLETIPGVKKIFRAANLERKRNSLQPAIPETRNSSLVQRDKCLHPWYIRSLQADRVWREFNVQGKDTLNIIADGNFAISPNLAASIFRNPNELPDNQVDDDGNGYVDDYHGYNFTALSNRITVTPSPSSTFSRTLHGAMCATIICGNGTRETPHAFGWAERAADI